MISAAIITIVFNRILFHLGAAGISAILALYGFGCFFVLRLNRLQVAVSNGSEWSRKVQHRLKNLERSVKVAVKSKRY